MNKKFKELSIQAQEEVRAGLKDPSRLQNWFMDELVQEKFAELIVRECIDVVEQRQEDFDSHNEYGRGFKSGIGAAGRTIKTQFDIKE